MKLIVGGHLGGPVVMQTKVNGEHCIIAADNPEEFGEVLLSMVMGKGQHAVFKLPVYTKK